MPMTPDRVLAFGAGGSVDGNMGSLEGTPLDKWNRLNEVLTKMQVERTDLQYGGGGDGCDDGGQQD